MYRQISNSVFWYFTEGLFKLKLKHQYKDIEFKVANFGTYIAFRETYLNQKSTNEKAILIVGFRLKLIGSNPFLHWLFQRVCIITTPFWSGVKGFGIKLWMVDKRTKNYLGIYQWYGKENTKNYVAFLLPILKFFSIKESIRYEIISNKKLTQFLIDLKVPTYYSQHMVHCMHYD